MDKATLIVGSTRDFAYSETLGKAVWCEKNVIPAYTELFDWIASDNYNVHTARSTKFN